MERGLGIELFIKATDKRKRKKVPLVRSVFKVDDMTESEFDQVREIIWRHLELANDEIGALESALKATPPPADPL